MNQEPVFSQDRQAQLEWKHWFEHLPEIRTLLTQDSKIIYALTTCNSIYNIHT